MVFFKHKTTANLHIISILSAPAKATLKLCSNLDKCSSLIKISHLPMHRLAMNLGRSILPFLLHHRLIFQKRIILVRKHCLVLVDRAWWSLKTMPSLKIRLSVTQLHFLGDKSIRSERWLSLDAKANSLMRGRKPSTTISSLGAQAWL